VTRAFDWDDSKDTSNSAKHGVSFFEAVEVFSDWAHVTIHDTAHSTDEDRFITIGMSYQFRLLVVVHADSETTIRIISARPATRREREIYEQEPDRPSRR
jgi:uncharacterized DUF497 family protein